MSHAYAHTHIYISTPTHDTPSLLLHFASKKEGAVKEVSAQARFPFLVCLKVHEKQCADFFVVRRLLYGGSQVSVPAGFYANLDHVTEHYRQKYVAEEERKAKKLLQKQEQAQAQEQAQT